MVERGMGVDSTRCPPGARPLLLLLPLLLLHRLHLLGKAGGGVYRPLDIVDGEGPEHVVRLLELPVLAGVVVGHRGRLALFVLAVCRVGTPPSGDPPRAAPLLSLLTLKTAR